MFERENTNSELPAIEIASELISATGKYQISVNSSRYRELLMLTGTPDWVIGRSKLLISDGDDVLIQGKCNPGLMEIHIYVRPLWNVHLDAVSSYATEEESLYVMNYLLNSSLCHEAKHLGDHWQGRFDFPIFRNYRIEKSARHFAKKQNDGWQGVIKVAPILSTDT